MFDISASIVLYNTSSEMLRRVVGSFYDGHDGLSRFLVLVDNSPIPQKLPIGMLDEKDYQYIHLPQNRGYGAAHNIALRECVDKSKYHIVLNPDIFFGPGTLLKIFEYMENDLTAVECMPRVVDPQQHLQYLCKLLPTPFDLFARRFLPDITCLDRLNNRYVLKQSGYDKVMDVPCLSGCFMFIRSATVKKENLLFDERFFMYLEDFDFVRRCHRVGRTVFYPEATIIHDHQRQSYKNLRAFVSHSYSAIQYFNKYGWVWDNERSIVNNDTLKALSI